MRVSKPKILVLTLLLFTLALSTQAQDDEMALRVQEELHSIKGYQLDRLMALGPEAVPALCEQLFINKFPSVIVMVLGNHQDNYAVPYLLELFETDKASVYISAIDKNHDSFATANESVITIIDDTATYTLDIVLTQGDTFIGGFKSNNVTIDYNDIGYADTIIFHVFEFRPFPRTDTQKQAMAAYLTKGDYVDALQPTFR